MSLLRVAIASVSVMPVAGVAAFFGLGERGLAVRDEDTTPASRCRKHYRR